MYANRRRINGERGKQLQSQRGEKIERNFAHQFDTGGMDRLYLRGRENIHKRQLIQAAACNLALLLRSLYGAGKPKAAHDLKGAAIFMFLRCRKAFPRGALCSKFGEVIILGSERSPLHPLEKRWATSVPNFPVSRRTSTRNFHKLDFLGGNILRQNDQRAAYCRRSLRPFCRRDRPFCTAAFCASLFAGFFTEAPKEEK